MRAEFTVKLRANLPAIAYRLRDKPTYGSRNSRNNVDTTTTKGPFNNTETSYSSAVRKGHQPVKTGTAKGGSIHQTNKNQKPSSNQPQDQSLTDVVAWMHQAVLEIQREVKDIKIEMEGFKAQISEIEHNIESITNPGPEFKAIRPSQLDLDMDMINDTYGQHGSFANVDDEINSFSQSSTDNSRSHGPTDSHVMKNVLSELENKDNKINALEVKINELVSTLNSLVSKTNDQ